MKHTPGPWHTRYGQSYTAIYAGEKVVGYIDHFNEHDKRLVTSAPELLDMLDRAVRRLEIAHANGDTIMREWIVDARAAIAKAGGES